jgi:hypothetical protein
MIGARKTEMHKDESAAKRNTNVGIGLTCTQPRYNIARLMPPSLSSEKSRAGGVMSAIGQLHVRRWRQ